MPQTLQIALIASFCVKLRYHLNFAFLLPVNRVTEILNCNWFSIPIPNIGGHKKYQCEHFQRFPHSLFIVPLLHGSYLPQPFLKSPDRWLKTSLLSMVLPGADHSKVSVEKNPESVASDSLQGILRVLFQLTEEGDFKLMPDEQQLGTQRGNCVRVFFHAELLCTIWLYCIN